MQVTLPQPKIITTQPAITKTISSLTIQRYADNPIQQVVRVWTAEIQEPIVLWDKTTTPTYAQVGQWTDALAESRLIQLYS